MHRYLNIWLLLNQKYVLSQNDNHATELKPLTTHMQNHWKMQFSYSSQKDGGDNIENNRKNHAL